MICKGLSFSFRTQTRGRTGMEVNPLVFETSASTDSAILACLFLKCGAKIQLFLKTTILSLKKGEKNEKIFSKHSAFIKYTVL